MAAKSSAEVAICRLVEETREGETLLRRDFLGLGCLAKFESVKFLRSLGKPKSNFFLVASKRAVLTKSHLMAIKKPRKDGKEISVKVVAEFLGMEDSKLLERRDLSDLCRSLKKDVYDLNGVTYVALTNQKGSSFLRSRYLEIYNFSQGGDSSVLRDELQCLVFRKETVSETTQQERTAAFSTQIYDLFHGNRDLATGGVDSPFVGVDFSTSASRRRFLKEDEFEKGDMPLGAVIVTKDGQLAGFLDFYNKHPVPLLFGSNFQETGDTMTHTGEESQGGASGGVSHMSYQSQLAGLRSRALDCLASENSAAGEMALQQQNVESYGDGDLQNNKSQGPFPTENSCRHMTAHLPPKDGNIESELSVGAAGCIYPPVESHILADSHISASGGSDDKSHPGGTAQPGDIKCTLDEKVAAAAQNDTDTYSSEFQFSGRNSNEHLPEEGNSQAVEQGETISELPVGAADAGGIYLPVDSDSLAGCNISVSGGDGKSKPSGNTQPRAIKHNLDNKAAAAAAERETNTDPSEVCMNGRSSNEVLAEEENSWAVGQECVVNGDHSLEEKEVDSTSSELMPPDGLGCQRVTPLTEISSDGASNTDINLIKKRSDKAHFRVPPDGISPPSTIISEEAMAKGANTFSLPSHNHKDTIPSRLVDPPDALSGQPSSLPNGVVSGGARSIETKAGTLPSTNQKETTPSRGFPPSGSVQSPLPSQALSGGASSDGPKSVTLPCKSDKDKGPTRAQPDGLSIQASSVTTDRAGNYVKVVALPTKNGRTQSGTTTPSGLCAQPLPVTTNAVPKGARNVASQDMSTAGHWIAGKSLSCPNDSAVAKKEERSELKRYKSELLPTPMEKKRKFKPSDPLAKTILGCLDLLEGLSRCLDKEYKYGSCKCWKHIAERFGIEEQEYQKFNCSQVHSPTEVMFEYLKAQNPEITIGDVKDGLHSIAREDVVRVLVKYEQTYDTVDNGTPVCSLFDTDPDIIGKIAFLMDMQKKGLKKWSDLASSLKVPRADFKTFETCNTEYPAAETLFKLVKIHFPRTTVGTLITHLKTIKRQDVIIAIRECTEVTEDSLLKNLMEELDVMENVCELLNQKQRTNRVKNWRHLGGLFNFEQETLDDLSPSQEENVCPTEALIQHLGGLYPDSTLEELILAIHLIDRDDALDVLDVYLEDGCIAHLLRLCDCKRCKKARGQEKGHADGL